MTSNAESQTGNLGIYKKIRNRGGCDRARKIYLSCKELDSDKSKKICVENNTSMSLNELFYLTGSSFSMQKAFRVLYGRIQELGMEMKNYRHL